MRNLRDGRRSHAFDNAGSRSACATCAMDIVPWTQRLLESWTRRQRKPSNPTRCLSRFLIVRDPRRSQLRRSTRSTICPSRAALLDAVTAMFGRSLRLPLALCSATDAVATMCNRSHLSASDGCAARSTTRSTSALSPQVSKRRSAVRAPGDAGALSASVEPM